MLCSCLREDQVLLPSLYLIVLDQPVQLAQAQEFIICRVIKANLVFQVDHFHIVCAERLHKLRKFKTRVREISDNLHWTIGNFDGLFKINMILQTVIRKVLLEQEVNRLFSSLVFNNVAL